MDTLAEAAAAADDVTEETFEGAESAEQPSEGGSGKKKQASKVEVGQRNLTAAQANLTIAQSKVEGVVAKGVLATATEKRQAARAEKNLPNLRAKVRAAEEELQRREERAAAIEKAEAARLAAAAAREEQTRAMSDAGLLMMVEQRLKLQGRFDNSSDTSDNIWKRIHHLVEAAVKKDELPRADLRGQKALEKRYSTEWGEFKLWCAKATRAISFSGVTADEVEDKVKEHYRVTTPLFLRYNMGMRPMAAPPWQISGDSAEVGGFGPPPGFGQGVHIPTAPDTFDAGALGGGDEDRHGGMEDDDDGDESGNAFDFEDFTQTAAPSSSPSSTTPPSGHATSSASAAASSAAASAASASASASRPAAASRSSAASASATRGGAPTPPTYSTTPPPLHMGGEHASSKREQKRSLEAIVAEEAARSRELIVNMMENQEKMRKAEREHELKLAQTMMGNGGCATS